MLHDPLPWFVLLNLPFFFIFYDVWNLNTVASAGSYLALGLNPYLYHNLIPGGLPIQLLGYGVYETLHASGSNFLLTADALKALYLALTYVTARVVDRVAEIEGLAYHRKLMWAFLLNPFLLFVNNIWVETDVIIVFLYVVGFAAIRYGWDRRGELRYLVLGVLAITLAIVSYYSIILLVPTLLIYRTSTTRRLQLLLAFLVAGGLFAVPLVFFGLVGPGIVNSLQSASFGVSPYSLFNLLPNLSFATIGLLDRTVLVLTVAAALLVPVVLYRRGAPEGVSLFVAYSFAYLLFVTNVQGDNFVLLVGLLFVALISLRRSGLSYAEIFALQAFLIPQFLIVQLVNGIGGVVGLYYWSYYQFHASFPLESRLGGTVTVLALLLVYLVLFLATLLFLLQAAIRRSAPRRPWPWAGPTATRPTLRSVLPRRTRWLGGLALLVAVLVLAPVAISFAPGLPAPSIATSGFDQALFVPYGYGASCVILPECSYLLASNGTFQAPPGGTTLTVASGSVPLGVLRNVTDQSYRVNVTATVPWPTVYDAPTSMVVLRTESVQVGVANALIPAPGAALPPDANSSYSSVVTAPPGVIVEPQSIYRINGSGYLSYRIDPYGLLGRTLYFALQPSNVSGYQETLWALEDGTTTFEAYIQAGRLYLGAMGSRNSSWEAIAGMPLVTSVGQWYLMGLGLSPNGATLSAIVNGRVLDLPVSLTPTTLGTLNVGRLNNSPTSAWSHTISANLTTVFSVVSSTAKFQQQLFVASSSAPGVRAVTYSGSVPILLTGGPSGCTLVAGPLQEIAGPSGDLWIGKLSDGPSSVRISFASVTLTSTARPDLLPIVASFGGLLPVAIAVWCVRPHRAPRASSTPFDPERAP